MQAEGALIANHSVSHAYMVRDTRERDDAAFEAYMEREVLAAERRIEEKLGVSHRLFVYPFGEYDARMQRWLRAHGFVGIGQHSGPVWTGSDFTAVPRFPFAGDYADLEEFKRKIATAPLPVANVRELPDPLLASRQARPELVMRLEPGGYRTEAIACYASGQGAIPVELRSEEPPVVVARAARALVEGRSRYNCTAPAAGGGWLWYSHPWLRLTD